MLNIIRKAKSILEKCRVASLTTKKPFSFLLFALLAIGMASPAFAITLNIKNKDGSTQLEFLGKSFWDYGLEQKDNILELTIDRVPEKELEKILAYEDELIKNIELKEKLDKQCILNIHLRDSSVESFAYQMESPSRLLIDFYINSEKKEALVKKEKKQKKDSSSRAPASEMKIAVPEKKEEKKEVAASEAKEGSQIKGLMDGSDPHYERFSIKDYEIDERAKIASKHKVYINFPFILTKNSFIEELESTKPIYKIKEANTKQNKSARVLLTIFKNGRYASFLEGLEVFKERYPDSKYNHMLRYMEADSHYELWNEMGEHPSFAKAMALYKKLIEDYPNSPLYDRTRMILAYGQFKKEHHVNALQELLGFINDKPNFKYVDELKISVGDAYLALNKFDDAIKTYNEVIETTDSDFTRKKAEYKIADVYAKQRKYPETISHYKDVIQRHPASAKEFDNAFFNLAEAQFRKKDYRKAHANYLKFLKSFPLHEHGAYALHRVGEIIDILTLNEEKIKGAFLENTFRFPETPGALLSSVRVNMYRASDMKNKELEMLANNVQEFAEKNFEINDLDHYVTAYLDDAFYKKGNLKRSWDVLQKYYKNNVTSRHIPFYRSRIARNLAAQIERELDEENYIEALRIYGKNKDVWLKDQNRLDLKYSLARTFEKTAAYDMAEQTYQDLLNQLYAIEGTKEQVRRQIFENIPTIDAVKLRLASSKYKNGDYQGASKFLKEIESDKDLSKDEVYERAAITAEIFMQEGDYNAAEKHLNFLVKSWQALPEKVTEPYLKLAEIHLNRGDREAAHKIYDRLIYHYKDAKSIAKETYINILDKKASAYLDSGQKEKAMAVLEDLVKADEENQFSDSRYKLGKLHFEKNNYDQAKNLWEPLEYYKDGEVWYDLAQDKLNEVQWRQEYDKYIQRMPAAKVRD